MDSHSQPLVLGSASARGTQRDGGPDADIEDGPVNPHRRTCPKTPWWWAAVPLFHTPKLACVFVVANVVAIVAGAQQNDEWSSLPWMAPVASAGVAVLTLLAGRDEFGRFTVPVSVPCATLGSVVTPFPVGIVMFVQPLALILVLAQATRTHAAAATPVHVRAWTCSKASAIRWTAAVILLAIAAPVSDRSRPVPIAALLVGPVYALYVALVMRRRSQLTCGLYCVTTIHGTAGSLSSCFWLMSARGGPQPWVS